MDNILSTATASAAPQAAEASNNAWICQICTYNNTRGTMTCDACSLPKGATPLLSEQSISQSSNLGQAQTSSFNSRKQSKACYPVAEDTKFSEEMEDSFIDRKPSALGVGASREVSDCSSNMDRKQRARPSPRFDSEKRLSSNLSIAKKSCDEDDDVSEYADEDSSTVKSSSRPRHTPRGKRDSAAKAIIDDNSFDFSAQAKKPIAKKEVAKVVERNQEMYNTGRITSQEQQRELTLSDQKLQLDELDDEIRAIETELTRLGERQMDLVERRMMIQTKINFLEQEQLDAERRFKENRSSYMY